MLSKLIFNMVAKNGARQLPMISSNTHRFFSDDLKKEFEELQKRLKEEKAQESSKKPEDRAKTMEELLKESREATKEQEAKLKQQFQEMKKQKTSLEFGDLINELREKPRQIFGKVKGIFASTSSGIAGLKDKVKSVLKKVKAPEKGAATEEIKQEAKVEEKIEIKEIKEEEEQIPLPKKPGALDKIKGRIGDWGRVVDTKMQVKMPGVYNHTIKYAKSFVKLWHETFPNSEDLIRAKMERVKKLAKEQNELEEKMKSMTEEEIKKLQDAIPEHMRKALVIKAEENKHTGGVWSSIAESDAAKKIKETKEYKEFTEVKQGVKDFADILKEELNSASSPTIAGARNLIVRFSYLIFIDRKNSTQDQKWLKRSRICGSWILNLISSSYMMKSWYYYVVAINNRKYSKKHIMNS